jgi:glyoxylase I family protein
VPDRRSRRDTADHSGHAARPRREAGFTAEETCIPDRTSDAPLFAASMPIGALARNLRLYEGNRTLAIEWTAPVRATRIRFVRPIGVHHVALNVHDVDAGITFYTATLGGVLRRDRPDLGFDGAWIDLGEQQLHLLAGVVPPASGQHFAIQVDDLDVVIQELRARDVEVSDATDIGTSRQAFLADPSGNVVELHELAR